MYQDTLPQPCGRWAVWGVLVFVVCAFLAADVATPSAVYNRYAYDFILYLLYPASVGICVGQLCLIAVWAILISANIVVRIAFALVWTMLMWYGLLFGDLLSRSAMTRNDAVILGIVLAASVTVLSIPLWIARIGFRWRLTRDTNAPQQQESQFSTGHLLLAMILISGVLAPLYQFLPPVGEIHLGMDRELRVLISFMALCGLITTIPCIWLAFASERKFVVFFSAWPVSCVLLAVAGNVFVQHLAVYFWLIVPLEPLAGILTLSVLNLSQSAAVFVTLWMFRSIGFRMVRLPGKSTSSV